MSDMFSAARRLIENAASPRRIAQLRMQRDGGHFIDRNIEYAGGIRDDVNIAGALEVSFDFRPVFKGDRCRPKPQKKGP